MIKNEKVTPRLIADGLWFYQSPNPSPGDVLWAAADHKSDTPDKKIHMHREHVESIINYLHETRSKWSRNVVVHLFFQIFRL